MWIRSQDKRTLVKVNRLWIAKAGVIYNLPPTGIEEDSDLLGEYESFERAVEVLDNIQSQLRSAVEVIRGVSSDTYKQYFIYQMPEE